MQKRPNIRRPGAKDTPCRWDGRWSGLPQSRFGYIPSAGCRAQSNPENGTRGHRPRADQTVHQRIFLPKAAKRQAAGEKRGEIKPEIVPVGEIKLQRRIQRHQKAQRSRQRKGRKFFAFYRLIAKCHGISGAFLYAEKCGISQLYLMPNAYYTAAFLKFQTQTTKKV